MRVSCGYTLKCGQCLGGMDLRNRLVFPASKVCTYAVVEVIYCVGNKRERLASFVPCHPVCVLRERSPTLTHHDGKLEERFAGLQSMRCKLHSLHGQTQRCQREGPGLGRQAEGGCRLAFQDESFANEASTENVVISCSK